MYNKKEYRAEESCQMDPMIEFKNVSFRYSDDEPWVLKNCTFTIDKNESLAIIGHNGSGKSTIAKLMNGLLLPNEGEIWIAGQQINEQTVWEVRGNVGMVFQNPDNQFVGATVQDDVAFGLENRGIERNKMLERIEEALRIVKMEKYYNTEPHRLSGGQKQRVAIASVIAILPEILILDEATVMLDPQGRTEIMKTIRHLQQERDITLITITHDLHEVLSATSVLVLNKGEIWDRTTPRDLMNKGQQLKEIGLDIPFITELHTKLKDQDISLTKQPLTIEEMVDELWTLHSKM